MSQPDTQPPSTRIIVMGAVAIVDCFRLAGIETRPDATPEDVERLLKELTESRQKALVLLEDSLARTEGPWLKRVRSEGGRIVVTQFPPLHRPSDYHTVVDDLLQSVLGAEVFSNPR
jgi:vacuolar-type H+-ATPase subunit F/Vma7